jgi:hypothetical protein
MTQSKARDAVILKETNLPRRDWVILPLLGLLTIVLMASSTEFAARQLFSQSKTTNETCLFPDLSNGVRAIPNSVCWEKAPEDGWVEYKFDSCGYRSGMTCGPKSPGTYRLVAIGSSTAMGARVAFDKTMAALLPKELSRLTERRVELYNEGMGFGFARSTALRFSNVLAAKPDLILWVLTPLDVDFATYPMPETPSEGPERAAGVRTHIGDRSIRTLIMDTVHERIGNIESGIALRHLLYEHESQKNYIQSSLALTRGDHPHSLSVYEDTGFLNARLDPRWELHLREFDTYATDVEAKAKAANVPLVAVLVPNRAQAAMLSLGEWPPGYDPYKLDDEVRAIIERHGGTFIDILPDFRTVPNPERHYFPVDGHLDANGQAMISGFLAKALTSGAVPALKATPTPQIASAKEN